MSKEVRSFDEIMSDLHACKEDLLRLHYAYSPQAVNYHQMAQMDTLKQQVKLAQEKLASFQSTYLAKKETDHSQNRALIAQNQELLSINEQLVLSNDRFKNRAQSLQRQKEQAERELQAERESKKALEGKHARQLQNLKLMQAQQLYMLRKKQKKG